MHTDGTGPRASRGLGLIGALFLVLVVVLLVAAVNRTVLSGAQSTSLTITNHKALLTAQSGAQLTLNRLFAPRGTGSCSGAVWNMTGIDQLRNCNAAVSCRAETVRGNSYFTIESTGECRDGAVITRRQVLVRARPG